jgi:Uma2 family endonuclease
MSSAKAELVEGVVYVMSSPVSTQYHGAPHAKLIGWLTNYEAHTRGVQTADNSTIRLDWDNETQPDALLRILPEFGGQSRLEEGYVTQAPELVAEIAATSASYDLHDKLNAYRRNGVREYIVWRVEDRTIDWFILKDGRYEPLPRTGQGHYQSVAFPGLWLEPDALVAGNLSQVLAVLQQGIASQEHAAFLDLLQERGR